jgi:aminoglycoside phosphotransferase (APT) family kinase protein
MSSEAEPDIGLIQRIVQTYLGGAAELIVDRSPSYSGSFVYAVDVVSSAGQLPCIVKLIPDWPDDQEVTNRVYGSRAASFRAAYALLQQHAIPLPQLYTALAPQPELPFYCYIMERLPGDDVQTTRARLSGASLARLDAIVGRHLGANHSITRSYDVWPDLATPHPLRWRDAFFTALHTILDRACVHAAISQRRRQIAQTFDEYAAAWVDPSRFVLSHGDGLQGMLVSQGTDWILTGVIDIEDHCFTDQRFALAVYEVSMGHAPLRDSFWQAYQQRIILDSTYTQFRPLFQLYVLLDWLGNVPPTQQDDIDKLTHQIVLRCTAAGR